jgi:hypothetical protein
VADLEISLTAELLGEGLAYEKAAFGLLEIKVGDQPLTACVSNDSDGSHYRNGSYLSGYHMAEWLAWNWWRLRWEPGSPVMSNSPLDWHMAHCIAAIGEGYLWPNITFSSDGFQCNITSERSDENDSPRLQYMGARPVTILAADFESAVDQFANLILQLVSDAGLANTNLQTLWDDLSTERNDPVLARFRRFEALLGLDPDQMDGERIENWLNDAALLGENALAELATGATGNMISAKQIADETKSLAFDMSTNDAFRSTYTMPMQWGGPVAWRFGVDAANMVRQQAGLSDQPINNSRLADLAGISAQVLESDRCTNSLSWVLHDPYDVAQVVLRPRWTNGRRFDVARLIGDQLFAGSMPTPTEPLSPATRSHSYRQKAQRAFAAELLSPWQTVKDILGDDFSQENQEQVAEYFGVSPMTIETLLINNERTGRNNFPESVTS